MPFQSTFDSTEVAATGCENQRTLERGTCPRHSDTERRRIDLLLSKTGRIRPRRAALHTTFAHRVLS